MDRKAMYKLSYGLFVLTAREGEKDNGCIINTAVQAASEPNQLSICVNKANYTHDMIQRTGKFTVSVLSQNAQFELFKHFGFQSGRDTNKFKTFEKCARGTNGIYYITEGTNAYISVTVNKKENLGSVNSDKDKTRRGAQCSRDDLFKKIKEDIKDFAETAEKNYVLEEIGKENFLPKQLTASNGVIPNQIHKKELKKILENAENYLPFLREKDESNLTVSERIVKMFEFQIPYYIGPISPIVNGDMKYSKNVWSVRKEAGKVYPWNFEQKIDTEESVLK